MNMFKEKMINVEDFLDKPLPEKVIFQDKQFCLTGNFEHGTKEEYGELIKNKGGKINENVTKETDYLVAGKEGNSQYKLSSESNKLSKAKRYKEEGSKISVISEAFCTEWLNKQNRLPRP